MLGNLKEILSVVQDGLSSSSNLRQTLTDVQRFKFGFHDKSQPKVELGAGAELLEHYKKQWAEIHEDSEESATAADQVDRLVIDIQEKTKWQLVHASDLFQSLSSLPKLTAAVEKCVEQLGSLQQLILTVESELTELEDLVDRHETAQRKIDHHYHLSLYKEKKLDTLEVQRAALAARSAALHAERERQRLEALRARGRDAADAFTRDVRRYLATGAAPSSGVPQTTAPLTLEQVQLDDSLMDKGDLDVFLNS